MNPWACVFDNANCLNIGCTLHRFGRGNFLRIKLMDFVFLSKLSVPHCANNQSESPHGETKPVRAGAVATRYMYSYDICLYLA